MEYCMMYNSIYKKMFNQVVILKQTLGARHVTMVQDIKYTYSLLLIFHWLN